jgi:hypothetical protein
VPASTSVTVLTLTLTLALTVMLTAEGPMLTFHAYGQRARSTALWPPSHAAWHVKQKLWVCAGTWQQEAKGVGRMRARGSVLKRREAQASAVGPKINI